MSAAKQPATKKELTPFQEESVATNQQNTPLPYLAGERLLAVRWITDALDKVTESVPASGKKG
jgi:hypothetical protein